MHGIDIEEGQHQVQCHRANLKLDLQSMCRKRITKATKISMFINSYTSLASASYLTLSKNAQIEITS